MKKLCYDVVVIGSGPAGLAAAIAARERGADVLILERGEELGGILLQCIHNGFGVEIFGEDLTGPEYAQRYVERALASGVEALLDTMALDITPGRLITATSPGFGLMEIEAGSIVLAMGCRERTRGQIAIPGTRPAGVYTAGTAQRFLNIEGYMPGERFVILGSGDIGMIMARSLTFEGAKVERVIEILPYLTGLRRNYVQCLLDFDIPLELSHTVVEIKGDKRVEAVVAVEVNEKRAPIPGTEEVIPCDTLLLSVGLIPENELSRKAGVEIDPRTGGPYVDEAMHTSVPGIFAAGNVVHVYDLVDHVTRAGEIAGRSAADYAMGRWVEPSRRITIKSGKNIRHVVPQAISPERPVKLQMRVKEPVEERVWIVVEKEGEVLLRDRRSYVRPGEMLTLDLTPEMLKGLEDVDSISVGIEKREERAKSRTYVLEAAAKRGVRKEVICITCPMGCKMEVVFEPSEKKVIRAEGHRCKRGIEYAEVELTDPRRMVTTVVTVRGGFLPLLPVHTSAPIPKDSIFPLLEELRRIEVEAPVKMGEVILPNALDLGIDVVASREIGGQI
jgi:NADPH-dependent 2,4-dienoyl-CoA reductase/sulfur reductase-like enzyme/CxxC motif-containing protein